MRYSIDTSALIHAWDEAYSPRKFPALWRGMEQLIHSGVLIAASEVRGEVDETSDLHRWLQERKQIFVEPTEKIQEALIDIVHNFSKFARSASEGTNADPYVIAVAIAENCKVVTQETLRGKSVKIPHVCEHYSIECINIYDFVKEQDWVFDEINTGG